MKYSVWNTGTRRYDYYEAQGDGATHAGAPPRASTSELGATPEQAAWPLPAAAIRVGSGELPQGRIASTALGGAAIASSPLVYVALGLLLWRIFR